MVVTKVEIKNERRASFFPLQFRLFQSGPYRVGEGGYKYGIVRYGMVWYGMVWYGMVWYCMVCYGMARYGMPYCGSFDSSTYDMDALYWQAE
jgi:hypothetical protein